jgi:hypothetical protein
VGLLSACVEELPGPVTGSLPRAFGEPSGLQLRLALVPIEARALLIGSRLLRCPLPDLLVRGAESGEPRLQRWARPSCALRSMLTVRVHLPTVPLVQAQLAAARFGIRCETFLVARAFELLRAWARAEPARWAFVWLPRAAQAEWHPVGLAI